MKRSHQRFILLYAIGVLLISINIGCASAVKQAMEDPYTSYRAEMIFDVNKKVFKGMGVAPLTATQTIILVSPIQLDRLEISSCGRHDVKRDVDAKDTWFGKTDAGYVLKYTHTPNALEVEGVCPLMFQAFSKDKQKAWGMVFFRTGQTLPAEMDCNGAHWTFVGMSVCQTKAGIEQLLTFQNPVEYEATPECSITTEDKKKFRVRARQDICKASFSDGVAFHDMVLLGYKQVVVY